ncbi:MAG TPA: RNA polymerase sigma factor [Dehalococcoidia bacterium]|nr:RNA polymerase sigma factor [Dehalococcoidia bacterium]
MATEGVEGPSPRPGPGRGRPMVVSGSVLTRAVNEDALLAARLKAGDPQAWERCYRLWYPRLFTYAFRRLGDREAAADIASDTFVRALKEVGRYDPHRLSLAGWLFRMAHARTVDHLRRQARRRAVSLEAGTHDPAEDTSERDAERGDLLRSLSRLTRDQQAVLLLRFYVGLSAEETGRVLGKPSGAVRALQFRALRQLRRLLGAEEEGSSEEE